MIFGTYSNNPNMWSETFPWDQTFAANRHYQSAEQIAAAELKRIEAEAEHEYQLGLRQRLATRVSDRVFASTRHSAKGRVATCRLSRPSRKGHDHW